MTGRLRRWRDTLWLTCGAGIIVGQTTLADEVSLPLLGVGVSLVGLVALLREDKGKPPPPAADEHPLDRHTRIAGMLDDDTRQWLLDQAQDLDGAVIHGMAVPAGYLIEVDPTSPADSPRLRLSPDNDHTPLAAGKIADGDVKADRLPAGQFELTNDEYNRYVCTVQRAQEIRAMLNATSEAFEQTPDGDPVAPGLQSQAANLRQALRDAQDDIRAQSDSWKVS